MGRHKIKIPKEILEDLYWKEYKSPAQIAKIYSCDRMTVRNRMRELGILTRSSSSARMSYRKFDFSGDIKEKAYLIGFRLGDLNVYQTSKTSDLIVARCNTTHIVQVELIKELFSRYGKVTISPGKYSTNVNCYLNKSFNFLLSNRKGVSLWIKKDKLASAAFIAGYTDAEGNFILNQKRARFKIDSYDTEILTWIADWLTEQNIKTKLRCIAKEGTPRRNGVKYNHNLWRINVNDAVALIRFIRLIKPFTRHKTRLHDMDICIDNIKKRINNGTVKYATN